LKLSLSLFDGDAVDHLMYVGDAAASVAPRLALLPSAAKSLPVQQHGDRDFFTSPSYVDPGAFPLVKSSKAQTSSWIPPSAALPIEAIAQQRGSLDSRAAKVHSQSKFGFSSTSSLSSSDKYPPTSSNWSLFTSEESDSRRLHQQLAHQFKDAVTSGKPKRERLRQGDGVPTSKNDFKTDRVHLYPQVSKAPHGKRSDVSAEHDALNPVPMNYTYDNMLQQRAVARQGFGYDTEENQSVALATEVIKDLKEKYSVSAVRTMYRRRKIHEEMLGRAQNNEERRRMKPDEDALLWRKVRVEENRRRKVGNPEDLAVTTGDDFAIGTQDEGGETQGSRNNSKKNTTREDLMYYISGLTLTQLSTDNFYKSEKEMECRKALKEGKSVRLSSCSRDNGGSAFDSRLALQMLCTTVLRDIEGGIIPRASEIYEGRIPTGDWEMMLEPKGLDGKDNKYKGRTQFEFKLPKEWNDQTRVARLTTAPV
jgi:hypothetical protein